MIDADRRDLARDSKDFFFELGSVIFERAYAMTITNDEDLKEFDRLCRQWDVLNTRFKGELNRFRELAGIKP